MMPGALMLEGNIDNRDETILQLQSQIEQLQMALKLSRRESERERDAIRNLRRQLSPLYTALQAIFGEIDSVTIVGGMDPSTGPNPAVNKVWESWKSKLPGAPSRIIDALLEHGPMSVAQIRVAAQCGQQTVYDVTSKLNRLGLINKNGGRYSLKEL